MGVGMGTNEVQLGLRLLELETGFSKNLDASNSPEMVDYESTRLAVALADASGVRTEYTYEAFGSVTATGLSSTNTFTFAGGETDQTGLNLVGNNYYDPRLLRLLGKDVPGVSSTDGAAQLSQRRTPIQGPPNTVVRYPRPGPGNWTDRVYGDRGQALEDWDYGHRHHHPDLQEPHVHPWDGSNRGKDRNPLPGQKAPRPGPLPRPIPPWWSGLPLLLIVDPCASPLMQPVCFPGRGCTIDM
jgi:hypothetical protein